MADTDAGGLVTDFDEWSRKNAERAAARDKELGDWATSHGVEPYPGRGTDAGVKWLEKYMTDTGELRVPVSTDAPAAKPTPSEPPPRLLTPERVQQFGTAADEALKIAGEPQKKIAESAAREVEILRHQAESQRQPRQEVVKAIDEELRVRQENRPQPPAALPERPKLRYNLRSIMGPPGSDKPVNRFMDQIGVLAAVSGRTPQERMLLAVTAFNGMIEGWAKGKQEDFQQRYNEWKDEVENIRDTETRRRQYIQDVLNDAKASTELKSLKLQVLGQEDGDRLLVEAAIQKQWGAIDKGTQEKFKLIDGMMKSFASIDKELQKQYVDNTPGIRLAAEEAFIGNTERLKAYRSGSAERVAAENLLAQFAQERGVTPQELAQRETRFGAQRRAETTYGATAGRLAGYAVQASDALRGMIPQVLAAGRLLDQSDWQIVNRLIQAGQSQSSNPKYNAYLSAVWDASRAYGRAMNPRGVPRVQEEREAEGRGILSQYIGLDAIETQLYNMWRAAGIEIAAAQKAIEQGPYQDPFAEPFPTPAPGTEQQLVLPPRLRTVPPAGVSPAPKAYPGVRSIEEVH